MSIWYNSYSGALKNAVDYFTNEWFHKPMGVVAVSEGILGGVNASNLMQLLILAINGYAMPNKLLVPELMKNLDEDGNPLTEKLKESISEFVEEFIWFTSAISGYKLKWPL